MNWAITQKSYSQRRACALAGIAPKVNRYRSARPDDGAKRSRLSSLKIYVLGRLAMELAPE